MISPAQASAEVLEVLNRVSLANVNAAGEQWLLDWFGEGVTHANERRADILACDDSEAELAGLLSELEAVGPFLNGAISIGALHDPSADVEIGPVELRALAAYIAEKKASLGVLTRFCDAGAPTNHLVGVVALDPEATFQVTRRQPPEEAEEEGE